MLRNLKENIIKNLNKEDFNNTDTVIQHQIDPETKSLSAEEMLEQLRNHLNTDEESSEVKESNRETMEKEWLMNKHKYQELKLMTLNIMKLLLKINAVNANVSNCR